MKKKIIILFMIFMFPTFVQAQEYETHTNQNGVSMEVNLYNQLCSIYSKSYIETITMSEFEKINTNDLNSIMVEEYLDPGVLTRGSYFSTSAKTIRHVKNGSYITLIASWKGVPKIKSYDVIAVRLDRVTLSGSYTFKQTYNVDNSIKVSYESHNQNFSNGFGSSFAVKNGTNLEVSLTFTISGSGIVYGSYQHASSTTTLSQSKNYTISYAGYGRVIKFSDSVKDKYDAMTGVDLYI